MDPSITTKQAAVRRIFDASRNGVNGYIRHPLARRFLYSDGVQEVAEAAGAYWLLDILATELTTLRGVDWSNPPGTGIVTMVVTPSSKAFISLTFADNAPPVWTRDILFTDFPEGEWTFELGYVDEGPTIGLILVSEH
jgi:hypothetical protein